MANTAPKHQATTDHAGLRAWVEEIAALTAAGRDPLVRRLGG